MRTPRIVCCCLVFLLLSQYGWGSGTLLRVSVFGDSLTAGYGLAAEQAFPARLEAALREHGYRVRVENAGVSGDTTADGLARLDWVLASHPDLMIVELGGNDALRGLDPALVRANLDAILTRLKAAGVRSLLAGMRAPRNLGRSYYTKFDRLYPELAAVHQVPFYPFFLAGVAGRSELNQPDGIHPTAAGVKVIVENFLPLIEANLSKCRHSALRPSHRGVIKNYTPMR